MRRSRALHVSHGKTAEPVSRSSLAARVLSQAHRNRVAQNLAENKERGRLVSTSVTVLGLSVVRTGISTCYKPLGAHHR